MRHEKVEIEIKGRKFKLNLKQPFCSLLDSVGEEDAAT